MDFQSIVVEFRSGEEHNINLSKAEIEPPISGPFLSIIKYTLSQKTPESVTRIPILSKLTLAPVRNENDRMILSRLVQLQKWWSEIHDKQITIHHPLPGCQPLEPIRLMNNNELVAKVSVGSTDVEIEQFKTCGENLIYVDSRCTSNDDLKRFARILTARILSVLSKEKECA